MAISTVIYGCAGTALSAKEKAFFRDVEPWGFILFRRNVETREQVRALVDALRATVGRADAPVLIDQEGGRVQRLAPPEWPAYPPARRFLRAANSLREAQSLVRLGARLMAEDLREIGINVDCVPVLDVPVPGAHDIIGDRAYSDIARDVAVLGRAAAEGLIAGGVLPVVKHVPGHGRAGSDSHHELPHVTAPLTDLAADFIPFAVNADMPLAMTAHVVYVAVDPLLPATLSGRVFRAVIRGALGYQGLVMSDDLSMRALSGGFTDRAEAALKAGCDVVLHCNGEMGEMKAVAKGVRTLRGKPRRRAEAALARIARPSEPLDLAEARRDFARLLAVAA